MRGDRVAQRGRRRSTSRRLSVTPFSTRKGWVQDRPLIAPVCALGHLWFMVLRLDLTEQSPGLFDPQGEGFRVGRTLLVCKTTLPARPAGGRAVTGVRYRAAGQAEKKRGPPQGPPNQKRWVQGGRTSSSWCSFLRLSSKESRAPARGRAGNHLAGANLRRSKRDHLSTTEDPRLSGGPLPWKFRSRRLAAEIKE